MLTYFSIQIARSTDISENKKKINKGLISIPKIFVYRSTISGEYPSSDKIHSKVFKVEKEISFNFCAIFCVLDIEKCVKVGGGGGGNRKIWEKSFSFALNSSSAENSSCFSEKSKRINFFRSFIPKKEKSFSLAHFVRFGGKLLLSPPRAPNVASKKVKVHVQAIDR